MFRGMRRKRQELSVKECEMILGRGTNGVLAVAGDDDYPYAVPLSYVYGDWKIIFHCAKTGHKIDAIERNEKVSFCVVDKDEIVAEELTTYFRSVIAFGKARIVTDEEEKRKALSVFAGKYSPGYDEKYLAEIENQMKQVCVVEIDVEHMTGKEAIELVKARDNKQ